MAKQHLTQYVVGTVDLEFDGSNPVLPNVFEPAPDDMGHPPDRRSNAGYSTTIGSRRLRMSRVRGERSGLAAGARLPLPGSQRRPHVLLTFTGLTTQD